MRQADHRCFAPPRPKNSSSLASPSDRSASVRAARARAVEEHALARELTAVAQRIGADSAQNVLTARGLIEIHGDAPRQRWITRSNVFARWSAHRRGAERTVIEE